MDASLRVTVFLKNLDFNAETSAGPGIWLQQENSVNRELSNAPNRSNQNSGLRVLKFRNFEPRGAYDRSFRLLGADVPNFLGIPKGSTKPLGPCFGKRLYWTP